MSAFGAFGQSGFASSNGGGNNVQNGTELQELVSPELGYKPINREAKVKILPNPWPENSPPPATSSLLSISQKHGLLAVGGTDGVVVAKTDRVRSAFYDTAGDSEIKPIQPDLVLPLGARISQVAFSSDGSCLAVSAEQGGGLALYSVEQLLQGSTSSVFEMPTNGTSLRALVPNPAPELASLFAIVTTNGELLVADMKAKDFRAGPNGKVYQTGASSVAWSTKGKALLVGLQDGTLAQYMADGKPMAVMPRPVDLPPKHHVSGLQWLGNDLAVICCTPDSTDPSYPDPSVYYTWERSGLKDGPKTHRFSKFPEVGIVNGNRLPNTPLMSTINKYHNVDHLVVVSSSGSEDVATLARSTAPLADGGPIDTFSLVRALDDRRMAALPMTEDKSGSTYPVGMGFDLTSKDSVESPVLGQEGECEQSGPLPCLMILNNSGTLSAWWLVYANAVLKGVACPGMASAQGAPAAVATPVQQTGSRPEIGSQASQSFGQASTPAFGKPAFGATSTPGQGVAATFGKPAFGATSSPGQGVTSAFGQASQLGPKQPTFGSSGFTSSPASGFAQASTGAAAPAFGSASKLGQSSASPFALASSAAKPSPWGTSATSSGQNQSSPFSSNSDGNKPAFGSPSKPGQASASFGSSAAAASPFGGQAAATPKPAFGAPSTFGSSTPQPTFGSASTFGSAAKTISPNQASKPVDNPFAKHADNPFVQAASKGGSSNIFGSGGSFGQGKSPFAKPEQQDTSTNAFGGGNFGIKSSFAEQATKSTDATAGAGPAEKSLFGGGFGEALSSASTSAPSNEAQDHEENMDDNDVPQKAPESPEINQSTTPQETPAAQKVMGAPPAKGGMFGSRTQSTETPAASAAAFGGPSFSFPSAPGASETLAVEKGKDAAQKSKDQESAPGPVPPESTSKDTYTPTNSSTSSADATLEVAEPPAPLPPNPLTFKPKAAAMEDMPPLPPNPVKSSKPPTSAPTDLFKAPPLPAAKAAPSNPFSSALTAKPATSKEQEAQALPDDDDDDDLSPLDDEGSGIDVANELSIEASPESSFQSSSASFFTGKGSGSFKQPSSKGVRSVFEDVPKLSVHRFEQPDPSNIPSPPRSPSPVRQPKAAPFGRPPPPSATSGQRAVSSFTVGKNVAGRKVTHGRQPPPQHVVQPIKSSKDDDQENERQAAAAKAQAQKEAEEQELSDHEDEYIRQELEAPIEPVTTLPGFVAHQDYTGEVSKEGVPGQIEIVYRDANSMVDTIGINLRGVKAWVAGHSKSGLPSGDVNVDNLEYTQAWTMVDTEKAAALQTQLGRDLEAGHIDDINSKLSLCRDLALDLLKLKKRNAEIAKTLEVLRNRNEEQEGDEFAPLSTAQSEAQQDLRRAFTDFRSNLASAEEGVALLKAKLASNNKSEDGAPQKVPTVEAVERTINKMTAMVEKKSADLDVLAAQLQKLGFAERPASSRGLLQGRRSRSGSPFDSPSQSRPGSSAKNASPLRASLSGKAAFTPRGSKLNHSLLLAGGVSKLSLGGAGGSALTDEDLQAYTEGLKQRKEVNAILKTALGSGPARIRPLDD